VFNSLVYQLLSEDQSTINDWKIDFTRALDGNGQVLLDIVPDLELLLGKQAETYNLGYKENKERFLKTIHAFLSVLDKDNRPLMFFIDDLQWADRASLELINYLLASNLQNILLIGSFRDNEVDDAHPLRHHIAQQKQEHADKISEIKLTELDLFEVNQLISDSLGMKSVETIELSELLVDKTQGNPFFIKQFLTKLVEEGHISFDLHKYSWTWELNKIGDLNVTENVVDLVINGIQKLSKDAQKVISLASCIGSTFDLESISIISQMDENDLSEALWQSVKSSLIHPLGSWTRYYSDNLWKSLGVDTKDKQEFLFRFQHDKIQQAAYTLIPETNKRKTHKEIGLLLVDRLTKSEINEDIFDILDHLNYGFGEDIPDDWKEKLAELNLQAGIKAKSSSAINTSAGYLKKTMDLMADHPSSELFKNALIHRSESAFLSGDYDLSESLFDSAIDKVESKLEKAEILGRKMAVYENTQRHELAIEAARIGLQLLGIDLPTEESQEMVFAEFGATQQLLEGKSTQDLLDNKNMEDPQIALSMKLLMNMWGPVYLLSRQNLLAFMILRMVQLSIKHGNSIESALAYSFYGYLISAQMHLYDLGNEFAILGIDLNNKLDDKILRSKVLVIAVGCVAHWKVPFKKLLPDLERAWEFGIETNDTIYAGYACSFMNRAYILKGTELNESYENLSRLLKFCMKINSEISKHQVLCWQRLVIKLTNKEADPQLFGKMLSEEEHLNYVNKLLDEHGLMLPIANFQVAMSIYDYVMQDYKNGVKRLEQVLPVLPSVLGLPEYGCHNVFSVLNFLGVAKQDKILYKEKQEWFQEQFELLSKRAGACPSNYGPPFLLAQGDISFLEDKTAEAIEYYKKAIDQSEVYEMKHFLALSNERLSELYFHKTELANGFKHLKSAYYAYKQWGAVSKTDQLMLQLEELASVISDGSKSRSKTFSSDSLDLQSIFDTATAISSEVVFGDLMNKLLEILIKNAGAQNAYLFLIKNKELYLEASMKMSNNYETEFTSTPLAMIEKLPKSLIRLVHHSGETMIINDAKKDAHIIKEKGLDLDNFESILCIPIKYHNKITGIIYLENTIMKNAFLPERVELLQLFSGQIAISIENAQLYQTLEQKVEERTRTIENQKLALVKEKHKADNLLLNILPAEVAEVLKHEGYYMPQSHSNVTILFTDFEDFTDVSQRISAEQLVEMIDKSYKAYDDICDKYGIEKIKTIGDSYMCVAGLSGSKQDHAIRMVQAAKEMMEFTVDYNKERAAFGLPYCDLRIGVHTGPVVAGVVGKKKFAFDIWGDSVNTASRMQSYGEAKKVNVSGDTWDQLEYKFKGIDRGEVMVKNKGKIRMYFIL
jgi:predicted ATPase/class 3 adenylate cyclase